jgi:SAM-dependent methyltransferase
MSNPFMKTYALKVRRLWMDARDRVRGRKPMIPPPSKIFIGDGNFEEIGNEFKDHLVKLAGLMPQHRVLDIGSGIGRMAVPLTKYLSQEGDYRGIEIVEAGVRWCDNEITPRYPNFQFKHANVYNKFYNPAGPIEASKYKLPFEDRSFDVVFLTSVFTHMMPDDLVNYFGEIARVLRPGGRLLATFFILNDESNRLKNSERSHFSFAHRGDCYAVANPEVPEHAIAFDEEFLLAQARTVGLIVAKPIYYGAWCGRTSFVSYQDIVVAQKASAN